MSLLTSHLRSWLGHWPPPPGGIVLVGAEVRAQPGWDGKLHPVLGVSTSDGSAVVSVTPAMAAAAGPVRPTITLDELAQKLGGRFFSGAFRWCEHPADLPDAGEWVPPDDRRVPDWLKPFNGGVLIAFEDGRYAAGVGIKRHDQWGHELSVGTEPAAQGRGLARRLVAQAARHVLAHGALPTYLHAFENVASAKVAEAAGFRDRGWRVLGMPAGE
jgi:RimJ/RimL family protein N-acetyltransferase